MQKSIARADVFMGYQGAEDVDEKRVDKVDMSVGNQVAIAGPQNDRTLAFDHHLRVALYDALASDCAAVSPLCFVWYLKESDYYVCRVYQPQVDICTLEHILVTIGLLNHALAIL
jgi:hypothetical protein